MISRNLTIAGLFLCGCGGATTGDSMSPTSAGRPNAPAEAAAQPVPPSPQPVSEIAAEDNSVCKGTELDLVALAAGGRCDLATTASPLPKTLTASLATDSLSLMSGAEGELRVVLTNTADTAISVQLDASCSFINVAKSSIYERTGKRIDLHSPDCAVKQTQSCAGKVIGVELAPGGTAFIRHPIAARITAVTDKCVPYTGRGLSAGRYSVKLELPVAGEPLSATMDVQPLVRIPRESCDAYAKQLAIVMQSARSLRGDTARQLSAECKQLPPPRWLADCKRAAKSAQQIKACEPLPRPI